MNIVMRSVDHLESAMLIEVLSAWRRVGASRMAPKREEMTPALLKSALPWIWMIDVVDGGKDFRFRIAGDRIIQFMGRRYAGHLVSEFADKPFFGQMRTILVEAMTRKTPMMAGPGRTALEGREYLEVEVLVLPLSEDGQNVTTLFGAMDIRPVAGPSAAKTKLPKGQP